ncbi:hypothetical protein niasHT_001345 [Heterodera trifolii]|uniref:Uncharacterized protein n=1 Tax=Heterodera trifolii TaxID=157864 RepID=A0ABD2LMY1_9BILA
MIAKILTAILLLINFPLFANGRVIDENARTIHPPTGCVIKIFMHLVWQICPEEPGITPKQTEVEPSEKISEGEFKINQEFGEGTEEDNEPQDLTFSRRRREKTIGNDEQNDESTAGEWTTAAADVQEMRRKKNRHNKHKNTSPKPSAEGKDENNDGWSPDGNSTPRSPSNSPKRKHKEGGRNKTSKTDATSATPKDEENGGGFERGDTGGFGGGMDFGRDGGSKGRLGDNAGSGRFGDGAGGGRFGDSAGSGRFRDGAGGGRFGDGAGGGRKRGPGRSRVPKPNEEDDESEK